MTNLTNNETNLLKLINESSDGTPDFQLCDRNIVKGLSKIDMDMNTAKGVLSSLSKKGEVNIYIDSEDAGEEGFRKGYSVFTTKESEIDYK